MDNQFIKTGTVESIVDVRNIVPRRCERGELKKNDLGMIYISPGPNIADPSDVLKIWLVGKAEKSHTIFLSAIGWRNLYRRFLVWAIRKHVNGLLE